jgi:microcystin-dependent protein
MVSLKHKFVTGKGDGPDTTRVRPTNWNAEHDFKTSTDAVVLGRAAGLGGGDVQELPMSSMFLPGMIVAYAANTAPAGWLMCAGQLVARATFPQLFAAIGTVFGAGDGTTTFALPDLRGRVIAAPDRNAGRLTAPWCAPDGDTLGGAGGVQAQTLQVTQMPSHNHVATVTDRGHVMQAFQSGGLGGSGAGDVVQESAAKDTSSNTTGIGVSISNVGGGSPFNNLPPTLVLNYLIKH